MNVTFYGNAGKSPADFDPGFLKDIMAVLMAPNGDYNSSDVRSELYVQKDDERGVPFLHDCQPEGWAKLRHKLWDQMENLVPMHYCYLLNGGGTCVHKVRCWFLKDIPARAK